MTSFINSPWKCMRQVYDLYQRLGHQEAPLHSPHPHPPPSPLSSLPGQIHLSEGVCRGQRDLSLYTDSNKALAESLDACVDSRDPSVNKILCTLATQAMVQAEYFSTGSLPPDQFSHYGLALDLYTHFTSPIRRYTDLVVRRQLLAAVGEDEEESLPSNSRLSELTQHMNNKHSLPQLIPPEVFKL